MRFLFAELGSSGMALVACVSRSGTFKGVITCYITCVEEREVYRQAGLTKGQENCISGKFTITLAIDLLMPSYATRLTRSRKDRA